MPEMNTFVINGTKYEVVDETARESIKGLAPAGYGLGDITVRKPVTEANASGFFATEDTPDGLWAWGTRTKFSDTYTIEEVTYAAGRKMQRVWSNGVPGEWEYFNPPMVLGVEYRTTERCEGKPVYAKRINCLAAPASVSISDLNIEKVVRWSGFVTYYGVALPRSNTGWKVDINRTTISTTSAYEQTSAHFYIDLYYIKN